MAKYGSDFIVDLLKALDIEYVAFNPGSCFKGLHDSIVNYGVNRNPELILCCHEAVAVSVAHGYAKAAMRPMAAMVPHNMGLLNASLSIFIAWLDQSPVLILGGTAPMAYDKRRPHKDWIHTALMQGNIVRDYVKWDDQPTSVGSLSDSLLRAYRTAMTEPKGPVYVCLDAELQEAQIEQDMPIPSVSDYAPPSSPQADPAALTRAAELLVHAERPVVIADYLGRNPRAVDSLLELAELLALPVVDLGSRINCPNNHPLYSTDSKEELLRKADVVLALDCDLDSAISTFGDTFDGATTVIPESARIVHITLADLALKSWCQHVGRLRPVHIPILADTSLALPALITLCRQLVTPETKSRSEHRFAETKARHETSRKQWFEKANRSQDEKPISSPFLASELWEQIKDQDWVVQAHPKSMLNWVRRLWDGLNPSRYLGEHGGGALGYGVGHCYGAALAHSKLGRFCIDIQPDGDLLYLSSSLWTVAHHPVPLLIVMFNNRSYYNCESHQEQIARTRGRPITNKVVGTRLDNPIVDFAGMARSFGLYAEGPVESPEELGPALKRAVEYVAEKKVGALVDVITQPR